MIKGIGVDIENIDRFSNKLAHRILSKKEYEIYINKNLKANEYLAGRFAAKEAIVKAYKKSFIYKEISVLNDEAGAPYVEMKSNDIIHISISHTKSQVIAYIIIEEK